MHKNYNLTKILTSGRRDVHGPRQPKRSAEASRIAVRRKGGIVATLDERKADVWIGSGLLALCAFAAWRTTGVRVTPGPTIAGASFVPWLMVGGISILSVIMIARALIREHGATIEMPDGAMLARMGVFTGILVAYAAAFMPIGYLASTALVFVAALWLFGERRILMLTLFPIAMIAAVYLGFTELLGVWLP
jgi:putative tricarboxylic transport membrane protein